MQMMKWMRRMLSAVICCGLILTGMGLPVQAQDTAPKLSKSAGKSVKAYIKKQGGEVTLVYHDLTTGEEYKIKPQSARRAASTIKLPLVIYIMELISQKKLNPKQKLTYHRYQYNGGSGVIQKLPVGSRFTISDLIKKAVIYSDNIAFVMLRDRVGRASFNQYIKRIGGQYAYPGGLNKTSAQDLTTYAVKLYKDSAANPNDQKLINYLEHTKYNETIPKGIPNTVVAHKAGWMPDMRVSNDVAIVYDAHPYTLAIMTNGYTYAKSKKVIAHLASVINKYHKKKYGE